MIKNDIFTTVVEKVNFKDSVEKLDESLRGIIKSGGKLEKNNPIVHIYKKLWETSEKSNQDFSSLVEEFRSYLRRLPEVEVILPFEIDEEFRPILKNKLIAIVDRPVMVKTVTNKDIIAGCILLLNGKVYDYSVAAALTENKESLFGPLLRERSVNE